VSDIDNHRGRGLSAGFAGVMLAATSRALTSFAMKTFRPRVTGRVNWYGLWTLYEKEVRHFLKTPAHTIVAPTVTSLLFLAIFTMALDGTLRDMGGVPFVEFLAPGLVMMAVITAATENPAGSIVQGKLQGHIVDVLMPPLDAGEFVVAYTLAGATRGLMVGLALTLLMQPFVTLVPVYPAIVLFYAVGGALALAMLGLLAGLWASKWDHLAMLGTFTITPLAFLSGVFYSIERLPESWRLLAQANPLFYIIDGFRYGFIGRADGSVWLGVAVVIVLNCALGLFCLRLVDGGYKLKS
jgi:ABC-2 type transport system permease protein